MKKYRVISEDDSKESEPRPHESRTAKAIAEIISCEII